MITFTRDEAQKLLDTLAEAIDAQQWELDTHISAYGEWFRPARVEYMRDVLDSTLRMIEILSHKLNTPLEPIRPGGCGGSGEPTVDGWPLYSGLPKPEPEPVCWMNANDIDKTDWKVWAHGKPTLSMPLFASPPQREWVNLTDKEIGEIYREGWSNNMDFARALEAKLREKNYE